MQGVVEQINVSPGGIPKRPVAEAIVTPEGIRGDSWAHPRIHGGREKTVLILCAEVIDELQQEGYPVFPGALGENFTVRGLDHRQLRSGQRFRLGEAVIQLTKIRKPCATLDVYSPSIKAAIYDEAGPAMDVRSPRWGRSGVYASVVRPGIVRPKDIIALMDAAV
jgi:MOSC domain-containing protein YiiM